MEECRLVWVIRQDYRKDSTSQLDEAQLWKLTSRQLPPSCRCVPAVVELCPVPTTQIHPVAKVRNGAIGDHLKVRYHAHVTLPIPFSSHLLLTGRRDTSLIRSMAGIAAIVQLFIFNRSEFFPRNLLQQACSSIYIRREIKKGKCISSFLNRNPLNAKIHSVWEHSWSICYPVGFFSSPKGDVQLFCSRKKMPIDSILPTICNMVQ